MAFAMADIKTSLCFFIKYGYMFCKFNMNASQHSNF